MASILSIGILDYFAPAFVFLLVFGILFALLEKTRVFGDKSGINSLVAFSISILFLLMPDLVGIVKIITPWFTILFIFIMMIVMLFLFVGVKESEVAGAFSEKGMVWIIMLIVFVIFFYALTQVYGAQIQTIYGGAETPDGDATVAQSVGKIIFHPKIMGMIVLLLIASQAVRFISSGIRK